MRVYVRVKAAGRRRPVLEQAPYELPDTVSTLRELLTALVRTEVERYNQKESGAQLIPFLTREEVEDQAAAGKVGFGRIYSDRKADPKKAVENALQCWQDGLVRVFRNEEELEGLEEAAGLQEGDCITLIRLTFLSGRLW